MTGQLLLADQPSGVAVRRWSVPRGGALLAVAAIGPSERPAWVLAHGIGSSARFISAAFAGPILAAGYRLVVYDLRGHGASSTARTVADHHLDVHAADLTAVVASLDGKGGSNDHGSDDGDGRGPGDSDSGGQGGGQGGASGDVEVVGGVSLGAHAAVRAVTATDPAGRPAPRVVLACLPAWVGRSVPGSGAHAAIARRVREVGVVAHREAAAADTGLAPWLREALSTDLGRHDEASLAAALLALDGAEAPTLEEVARVTQPLAVLAWGGDPGHPLAVAERWATAATCGRLTQLALRDLDVDVDRLGARAVAAVRAVAAAGVTR